MCDPWAREGEAVWIHDAFAYRNMAAPARKAVARAPLAMDTAEAPLVVVEELALELEPDVLAEDLLVDEPELPESVVDATSTVSSSLALAVDSVPASDSDSDVEPASLSESEDDAEPAEASEVLSEEPVLVADAEAADEAVEAEVDVEVDVEAAEPAEAEAEVEELAVQ